LSNTLTGRAYKVLDRAMSEILNDDELTPEGALAMQTALSVLADDKSASQGPAKGTQAPENGVIGSEVDAVERAIVSVEPEHRTEVRRISRRDAIPISEKHVLVMWGLSTYRFQHPRGVTFVVDNSRLNVASDQQYREALVAAMKLACAEGLPFVYVLD
jgi:hypothetical protein